MRSDLSGWLPTVSAADIEGDCPSTVTVLTLPSDNVLTIDPFICILFLDGFVTIVCAGVFFWFCHFCYGTTCKTLIHKLRIKIFLIVLVH